MVKKIRLIGVGFVPAIPAKELQAGDRFMRDRKYTYKIIRAIPNKSGKSVTFIIEGETNEQRGQIFQRNFLNTTFVAKLGLNEVVEN
jgi:hypothetical protein